MNEQVATSERAPKHVPVIVPERPDYRIAYWRRNRLREEFRGQEHVAANLPEVTLAYKLDNASGKIFIATALCSPKDQFHRKLGRKMAFERLDELLAKPELANESSRTYIILDAQELVSGLRANINRRFLRESAAFKALNKALDEVKLDDMLNTYVWDRVMRSAFEVSERPTKVFVLTPAEADALFTKTEEAVASAKAEATPA